MELTDRELDAFVTLTAGDAHPLRIARLLNKPPREVASFWHVLIGTWRDMGEELPPRVAAYDARKGGKR